MVTKLSTTSLVTRAPVSAAKKSVAGVRAAARRPAPERQHARRVARRTAIIAVAAKLFRERGYPLTTMSYVAEQLGGSKGTLWRYFPSKEALFAAFMDEATEQFRLDIMPTLDPDASLQDTMEAFCFRFIRKLRSPDIIAMYRLIIGECGRAPEIGRLFYERGPETTANLLAAFLHAQMLAGRLSRCNPHEVGTFILSLCTGLSHTRALLGMGVSDDDGLREEAAVIAQTLMRAYGLSR